MALFRSEDRCGGESAGFEESHTGHFYAIYTDADFRGNLYLYDGDSVTVYLLDPDSGQAKRLAAVVKSGFVRKWYGLQGDTLYYATQSQIQHYLDAYGHLLETAVPAPYPPRHSLISYGRRQKKYFQSDKSAEEVCDVIQSRVQLYLDEQK